MKQTSKTGESYSRLERELFIPNLNLKLLGLGEKISRKKYKEWHRKLKEPRVFNLIADRVKKLAKTTVALDNETRIEQNNRQILIDIVIKKLSTLDYRKGEDKFKTKDDQIIQKII